MKTIEERANINFANGIITNKHDYIEDCNRAESH